MSDLQWAFVPGVTMTVLAIAFLIICNAVWRR